MKYFVIAISSVLFLFNTTCMLIVGATESKELSETLNYAGWMIAWMFIDLVAIILVVKEEILKAINTKG